MCLKFTNLKSVTRSATRETQSSRPRIVEAVKLIEGITLKYNSAYPVIGTTSPAPYLIADFLMDLILSGNLFIDILIITYGLSV
jgi:hypothetical protein